MPVRLPFIWCWNSDCWAEFGPCKNSEDGIRAPGSTIKHLFQSGAIIDGLSNCSMWSASYIEVNTLFLLHFLVEQAIESDHDEELKNDHVTAWVDTHSQDTLLGTVKLVQSSNPVQRFFKRYCYSLFHKSSAVEKIETFLHHNFHEKEMTTESWDFHSMCCKGVNLRMKHHHPSTQNLSRRQLADDSMKLTEPT
jgi:hypothetical protein